MHSNHVIITVITFLLSLIVSHQNSSANFLDNSNVVGTDLGDLDLYSLIWMGPWTTDVTNQDHYSEEHVIDISTKNKERYKCIIPDINAHQLNFDSSAKNSSFSDETEVKNPFDLIEPLFTEQVCSIKSEIFWIYELCHGKHLRQFHSEGPGFASKITQEYSLGTINTEQFELQKQKFAEEAEEIDRTGLPRPSILVNGHYKPYLLFNMTGGTKCDLTETSRTSRIVYVCSEGNKNELFSIKEIATCEYEAVILTPLLCKHKDFKPDNNTYHIKCYSMDGAPNRPKNLVESMGDDYEKREGEMAFFHGRTLIIDADIILS